MSNKFRHHVNAACRCSFFSHAMVFIVIVTSSKENVSSKEFKIQLK